MATAMSTLPTPTVTDKLLESYNSILLHISDKLDSNHLSALRHYCDRFIPKRLTDTMDILRSLEYKTKISWEDMRFLKDAMNNIGREDIAKELTEFEIKRDLTLLLDFYAKNILNLDLQSSSVSVKIVAGHLVRLMEIVPDKVDITAISLTVESSKDVRKAVIDFEEVIDCSDQAFSWNEFTVLVVIAGEIIAAACLNEERREKLFELCSTAADELSFRMTELGSWNDFCTQVKERYKQIYHRQNMESNRLFLQKKIAEVVKQLTDAFRQV